MRRARLRWLAMGAAAVLGVATAAVGVSVAGHRNGSGPESAVRLPDLDQETPTQLAVREQVSGGTRSYLLGFRSAIRNVGDGPLIIEGHRSQDLESAPMSADQLIDTEAGSTERVPGVGELRFVTSADHDHWHLLGFDRYELRRAGSSQVLVQDRKTGFCLGDRYRTIRVLTGAAAGAVYTGKCGLARPDLMDLVQGISVGYGDDYSAYLEYQELSLDGVPAGRYVLVHRVNTDLSLRELSYANNAASVLLDLRWRGGKPYLRVLATCPDSDRCDRQVRVRTVATGLEVPWDIAFLPDGRALVTERPGRVRLLEPGGLQRAPVAKIAVAQQGEGGLLGLAIDPDFSANQLVYLYFTGPDGMRLERWRWTGSQLVRQVTLVDAIEAGEIHDSGRIAFGPDRRLYVATGDAGHPELAQDPGSLNGKLLALSPEQYRGTGTVRPAILASGLRNSQGFDWQPGTGALIANDHGPSGFDGPEGYDEVNQIVAGGNYGWPEVISNATGDGRYLAPLRVYADAIAPSGATFLTRPGSPWQGDYVLASLVGQELRRLSIENGRVVVDEPLLHGQFGRLRTVKEGPDGCLYVLTSNRDGRGSPRPGDDRILCVQLPRR
ncbi:MAG: Quinoprotein glucose dehydrogenase [Nocardioides sp.]|nr:Quinoprotein glucose dehydrogenase [Nocardioides sp.]